MMIYCARITAIPGCLSPTASPTNAHHLRQQRAEGLPRLLAYRWSRRSGKSLMILPGDRLLLAGHDYLVTSRRQGAAGAV